MSDAHTRRACRGNEGFNGTIFAPAARNVSVVSTTTRCSCRCIPLGRSLLLDVTAVVTEMSAAVEQLVRTTVLAFTAAGLVDAGALHLAAMLTVTLSAADSALAGSLTGVCAEEESLLDAS